MPQRGARLREPGARGDVVEAPAAVVAIQAVLAVVGDEEIVVAVVVVVAGAGALAPARWPRGPPGAVTSSNVPSPRLRYRCLVGSCALREALERRAVDEEEVEPAVAVVVEHRDAAAGRLEQIAVRVLAAEHDDRVEAGAAAGILEGEGWRLGHWYGRHQDQQGQPGRLISHLAAPGPAQADAPDRTASRASLALPARSSARASWKCACALSGASRTASRRLVIAALTSPEASFSMPALTANVAAWASAFFLRRRSASANACADPDCVMGALQQLTDAQPGLGGLGIGQRRAEFRQRLLVLSHLAQDGAEHVVGFRIGRLPCQRCPELLGRILGTPRLPEDDAEREVCLGQIRLEAHRLGRACSAPVKSSCCLWAVPRL